MPAVQLTSQNYHGSVLYFNNRALQFGKLEMNLCLFLLLLSFALNLMFFHISEIVSGGFLEVRYLIIAFSNGGRAYFVLKDGQY